MRKLFKKLDKIILNLLTVLISGAGVFAIFMKFYSPEINYSFWNENPFLIKQKSVDGTITLLFVILTLFGLLIQVYKEIWGNEIKERNHNRKFYLEFFFVGIIVMIFVVHSIAWIGSKRARQKWLPSIIKSQKTSFKEAKFIIEHHYLERYKSKAIKKDQIIINREKAEKNISRIEKLLDINSRGKTLEERMENLKKYFSERKHR